ncbi:terminase small subunit [Oscillospiraceae bacterium 38-13]
MKLTPKQERFVQEYLVDLNSTAAARRAGYSTKTADRIGPELLGKTCVSQAIQEAIKQREKRTEVTQDYVIEKLKQIADKEASDAQESNLKFSNKLKALELLGKHVGAFEPKQDETASNGAVRIIIDV